MPSVINERNRDLLALYGISLKKEQKSFALMQLKNCECDTRVSSTLYSALLNAIESNIPHTVKLPEITFGVELEFVGSKDPYDISNFNAAMSKLLKEKYFYTGVYTHNDGTSWILGKDSSINVTDSSVKSPFGFELSSPKLNLSSDSDIAILATIISYVKTFLHGEVNESCGTHIHIGFKRKDTYRGYVCDVLSAYSEMEKKVFDTIVPTSRRRNRYCKHTMPYPRQKYQKLSSRFCNFSYDGTCKNLHFEFRQLEGTLDINTILYWARFQSTILYDLIDNVGNHLDYVKSLMKKNIFEILFHYGFDSSTISFFIKRVIDFKSRTLHSLL